MLIVKAPSFENDDYLFRITGNTLQSGEGASKILRAKDQALANYYDKKRISFLEQDTDPSQFEQFSKDRPSLRCLSSLEKLDSTIYTVAVEKQNGETYGSLLSKIKEHLNHKAGTRRCLLRFSNDLPSYFSSEISKPSDVTCLSFIHYFSNSPRLVFRASDVGNELVVDILTIFEFFLKPIYQDTQFEVSVYASTSQNIKKWQDTVDLLEILGS